MCSACAHILRHTTRHGITKAPTLRARCCNCKFCFDRLRCGRFSAGKVAHILFSIGISADCEVESMVARLKERGFPTLDLSAIEAAQVGFLMS